MLGTGRRASTGGSWCSATCNQTGAGRSPLCPTLTSTTRWRRTDHQSAMIGSSQHFAGIGGADITPYADREAYASSSQGSHAIACIALHALPCNACSAATKKINKRAIPQANCALRCGSKPQSLPGPWQLPCRASSTSERQPAPSQQQTDELGCVLFSVVITHAQLPY